MNDEALRARAAFILEAMGNIGTQAMAVGARDLAAGPHWLKQHAEAAKVPLVSANLVDANGERLFPASVVLEAGGKKVGVIGVSPAGVLAHGAAKGLPIAASVAQEARRLRKKVDLIVVLAAVPYPDALQLSTEVGRNVDFIIQSHEGRGQGMAQRGEDNFILPAGERGRMIGKLVLELDGKGPFVDAQERQRDEQTLQIVRNQVTEVNRRLAAAKDPETKQQLRQTLASFQKRQAEVEKRLSSGGKAGGRRMNLEWVVLTAQFSSDEALEAQVRQIEPNGATH